MSDVGGSSPGRGVGPAAARAWAPLGLPRWLVGWVPRRGRRAAVGDGAPAVELGADGGVDDGAMRVVAGADPAVRLAVAR